MRVNPFCLFFLVLLFLVSSNAAAQNIATFQDRKMHTWVFENGNIEKLEFLEVPKQKIKGPRLLYINSKGYTIEYKNGKKRILDYVDQMDFYHMSDHLLVTNQNDVLAVVEATGKNTVSLDEQAKIYMGDSILVFRDFDGYLKMYQDGEVTEIQADPTGVQLSVSDNSFALLNEAQEFYFYQNGVPWSIGQEDPMGFRCGRDFVVYIDEYEAFKLFYDDELKTLDDFRPISYKTGDNILAYVDDDGDFNMVYKGEITNLDVEPPRKYYISNNMLVFVDSQDFFKVWYEGEMHTLQTYNPGRFKYFDGVVVWQDNNEYLQAFYEGKQVQVSKQLVDLFDLTGRVITYQRNNGDGFVYWNGEHYRF